MAEATRTGGGPLKLVGLAIVLGALVVSGVGGFAPPADAQDPQEVRYLCASKKDGALRYVASAGQCSARTETSLELSEERPVLACAAKRTGSPVCGSSRTLGSARRPMSWA